MTKHTCPDGKTVTLAHWPCPFCGMRQTDQKDETLITRKRKIKK